MNKMLIVDLSKCTGCGSCVDVCSGRKTSAYSEKASRIRIIKDQRRAVFIPLVCEQCREHICADICPAKAIQYDPDLSIFTVDEETCTGCGACEKVCPYGGIFISEGTALKCDLCGGDPACVKVCYSRALQYVETNEDIMLADLQYKTEKLKKIGSGFYD